MQLMSADSAGTRRDFLKRAATGAAGLAVLPNVRLNGLGNSLTPLPITPGRIDEAYWRDVKAQFIVRDGFIMMNAANLCPAPRTVVDAVTNATRDLDGDVSFQNRDKFNKLWTETRSRLARFIGAGEDEVAIVRNTSEANNCVVGGVPLKAGDDVLLFDENHPTNNVAWDVRAARYGFSVRRVKVDPASMDPTAVVNAFRQALQPNTRVLSITDVSSSTGVRLPTAELCAIARERGIWAHVDGAQTLGALRRDMRALGCDTYSASAHKWFMGPKEAGVLFIRKERCAELWPGVVGVGWGGAPVTQLPGARKFETLGQRNDATVAGLAAAVDFHERIGEDRIEARVLELTTALYEGLRGLRGAQMVTPARPEMRAGVCIVRFEGREARPLHEALYREHQIATAPTGGLRFSPHIYNTMDDVQRALAAVRTVTGRPA
jgi:selenocysteine lyase/cysteine desulfurase